MDSILKKLYYGKIIPWEETFVKDSEYGRTIHSLTINENKLLETLNDEEKELYKKISYAQNELSAISVCNSFTKGFSLGMKITIESLRDL